jgi:hypothetical protein
LQSQIGKRTELSEKTGLDSLKFEGKKQIFKKIFRKNFGE